MNSILPEYNKINNFILINDKKEPRYLFFDIFSHSKKVFLICPGYTNDFVDFNNIVITFNNTVLSTKLDKFKFYLNVEYESIAVLIFKLPSGFFENIECYINLTVKYKSYEKNFNIPHITYKKKPYFITQTTLCKYDYKLIVPWYNYYTSQGTEHFFIYYNGKINEDIKTFMNKKNITLIEWDYYYFSHGKINNIDVFHHHAQMGQMNHNLWKYSKILSHHLIVNDLDEYMHIPRRKLSNYLKRNRNLYDAYCFKNRWSKCIDESDILSLKNIPDKIKISNLQYPFGSHSKMIYKCDKIFTIGVHKSKNPSLYKNPKCIMDNQSNLNLFHFINWSKIIYQNYDYLNTVVQNRKLKNNEKIENIVNLNLTRQY